MGRLHEYYNTTMWSRILMYLNHEYYNINLLLQVFSSGTGALTQPLPEPVTCRFVKLHPKSYKVHPCLMLELHGCVPWWEVHYAEKDDTRLFMKDIILFIKFIILVLPWGVVNHDLLLYPFVTKFVMGVYSFFNTFDVFNCVFECRIMFNNKIHCTSNLIGLFSHVIGGAKHCITLKWKSYSISDEPL